MLSTKQLGHAVWIALDHRCEHASQLTTIESVGSQVNRSPQMVRTWVKQHEVDAQSGQWRDSVADAYDAGTGLVPDRADTHVCDCLSSLPDAASHEPVGIRNAPGPR